MTAIQIRRKLDKAGVRTNSMARVQVIMNDDVPPGGHLVLIRCQRDEVEVIAHDHDGDVHAESTEKIAAGIAKALGFVAGYRTGYGAWVIQAVATPSVNR